ncbi:acetoacetate decarboxylase family protein [Streptomyces sp. NPDC092296]|uniref:acetoacetate decarboxylase family protein n=1 Tax=Streptomyces sp. NPDC092296 TaxID=3366012 RepID=UPI0037FD57D3
MPARHRRRRFSGVRLLVGCYEADGEQIAPLLPAGVTPWDDPVRCLVWGLDFPLPGVEAYRLAGVSVRVALDRELHYFFPVAYSHLPEDPAAGRVGAAGPRRTSFIDFGGGGGQRLMTVGSTGRPLITLTTTPDRPADLTQFGGPPLPLLQLRGDPDIPRHGPGGAHRLVRTDVHLERADLRAGPGLVTVDMLCELDSLYAFAPARMLDCLYGTVELWAMPERTVRTVTADGGRDPGRQPW